MSSPTLLEKCCLLTDAAAGDPTHFMIDQTFERLGIDWRFSTFEIGVEQLPVALAGLEVLGFGGVLVAEHLRAAAAAACRELTPAAQRAASASTLVRLGNHLVGDNTLAVALRQAVGEMTGRHAVVLGSGPAARAFAAAVIEATPASLTIASRQHEALEQLATDLRAMVGGELLATMPLVASACELPSGTDLVILAPDGEAAPDIDATQLDAGMIVVDHRLSSSRTRLIKAATEHGATVIDGITLLVNETALAVERWIGKPLDRTAMRDAVEEYLGV